MKTKDRVEQIARQLMSTGGYQVVESDNTVAIFPAKAVSYLMKNEPALCEELFDSLEDNETTIVGKTKLCKKYEIAGVKLPRFMLEKSIYDAIPNGEKDKTRWINNFIFSIKGKDFLMTNQWQGHEKEDTKNHRINDFAILVYDFFQAKYFVNFNGSTIELCCVMKNNKTKIKYNVLPLQTIFYGAPGTGKSHKIDGQTNDDNSIRTTFHPDTDYATFVGAYKPMMEIVDEYALDAKGKTHQVIYPNGKKSIVYKYEPQVFLKAYVEAWKRFLTKQEGEDDSFYLVIEEINRGNCAQIFGDLFQLLDREDDGYSSYAISPESSITKYLAEEAQSADGTKFSDLVFSDVIKKREDGATKIIATADDLKAGKRLVLPPNLHIWATMNTSDQSLFPIDSAFKRRWDWEYVPIKRADKEPENKWIIKVTHGGNTYWCYWWEFLEAINHQIEETTHSEDKQLGYFFAKPKNGENFISTDTFVNKVIFYLWNDVFKDEDSAVFQYDNDKVEDVSISRSGAMYFRHFMENKDEMIHYFINQLFAMGEDNNPVVPIDYLKYDNDPKVIEHLPKMREDCEETPLPTKDKGEENDEVAKSIDISGKSIDACQFSNNTYKAIAKLIDGDSWMQDKTREYFSNWVDVKFTDMAISGARLSIAFNSSEKQAEIKLYIPHGFNKSDELCTYLRNSKIEDKGQYIEDEFNKGLTTKLVRWHEFGDMDSDSNKVKGWALTLEVNYNDDAKTIASQITSLAKEFFAEVDPMISLFINQKR